MRSFISVAGFGLLMAVAGAGCSDKVAGPTPIEPTLTTETFTGTVAVNGASTHSFQSVTTGPVTATLITMSPDSTDRIGLSLGTWNGAACAIVIANDQAVRATVVTGTVTTVGGSLCVRLYDVGGISEPTAYTVTVSHP